GRFSLRATPDGIDGSAGSITAVPRRCARTCRRTFASPRSWFPCGLPACRSVGDAAQAVDAALQILMAALHGGDVSLYLAQPLLEGIEAMVIKARNVGQWHQA